MRRADVNRHFFAGFPTSAGATMMTRGRKKGQDIPADERAFDPESEKTREEVRDRLRKFIEKTFGSVAALERATGASHGTVTDWMKGRGALPLSDNLLRLSAQGLSLDWLVTGQGPMQTPIGFREEAELLEYLRPHLQKLAREGDHTARMAFHHLRVHIGADRMMELAAEGLREEFTQEVDKLNRLQQFGQLQKIVTPMIWQIEDAAKRADAREVATLLAKFRAEMDHYLAEPYRSDVQARAAALRALAEDAARRASAFKDLIDTSSESAKKPNANDV
jgi:hypothetical protein